MNFVGPFAQSEENARKFGTSLLFSSSAAETMKVVKKMDEENKEFVEKGDKLALDLNNADMNMFLDIIYRNPFESNA
jgi:ERCC4-type nuclease